MNRNGDTGDGESTGERYRFGDIAVDAVAHTLLRAGQPVSVEPKAFAVLLMLLRHAGELVNRDDLLDAVWGHRHVTPGVLTRVIAQLRHALDDQPHEPRYIQTLHALGYRFVGELERGTIGSVAVGVPTAGRAADADPAATRDPREAATVGLDEAAGSVVRVQADPAQPRSVAPHAPASAKRRLPRWLGAAALLVVVALATVAWLGRKPASTSVRPAEASIAVLPFTSLSSERDDRYFAEGLAIEMHDALAGVRGLKVAAQPAGGLADQAEVDVKALGKALGVATVLAASVRREGARVRINARLSDTATGFTLWSKSYDRESTDVFALQSEIANQVVQSLLGVLPADLPRLDKRLAPTRDISAYDAYLKGLQQLQATDSEEHLGQAITFFGQALAADGGFARAQAGICRAEIGRFESARDPAAFARAQAACARAANMDPELREVSLALGELHRVRGETDQAVEHYTQALDDVALRPAAYIGLARTQSALGNNQLALDYFQRARELRPGDSAIYRELGYHQYLNDDLPHAIESFRAAATLRPDDAAPWSSLGGLYLASGDSVQASEAFHRSLAIEPSYAALSNLGTLKYDEGAYAEAAALYRRAAELDPDDYRVWGNIGDALSAMPAIAAQAGEPYRRAARMVDRYVGIKPDDAQALGLLAWYRANLGERPAALDALARAEALATERGEIAFLGAQTLALLGDVAGARERLGRARSQDIPQQRIDASPVLRGLDADDAPAPPALAESARP